MNPSGPSSMVAPCFLGDSFGSPLPCPGWLLATLALALSATAPLAAAEPASPRRALLRGDYAAALRQYEPAAPGDPQAAVGLARALSAQGRPTEAQQRLTALLASPAASSPADARWAPVAAELAQLAFQRGDHAAARQQVAAALRAAPDEPTARWLQAELDRLAGRLDAAEAGYRWLIGYYNQHEIRDPDVLRAVGQAAAQYARWNRQSDQFQFLVRDIYPDALKLDPDYWPAAYEMALLFLEKHNPAEARRHLKAALAINPHAAAVHWALARAALEDGNLTEAQAALARALADDGDLLPAWQLKADLLWANFQPRQCLELLEKECRRRNPLDEATLGRLAACYVVLDGAAPEPTPSPPLPPGEGRGEGNHETSGRPPPVDANPSPRLSRLITAVEQRNPHAGDFYFHLAAALDARDRFTEAERYYHEALLRVPRMIGPPAALGLMAMHGGDESQARRWFKEAFRADPFDVRVKNMLEVLEVLDEMPAVETPRGIIRYHPGSDAVLARYMADCLEEVYPRLCRRFGYTPPGKALVEVFDACGGQSGHRWFSTRLTGLPYLGTVAASTGRMVAMVSPNDRQFPERFNWARVITHELVHVVTLQQTNFNCPHWYTEGLAVWSEPGPSPWQWRELLARRAAAGRLFNLETINAGFTRPTSGEDNLLAYCQAELYVEYMIQRAGQPSLNRLLEAYAANLDTPAAIRRVFGVEQDRFEWGYREFLRQRVAAVRLELIALEPLKAELEEAADDLLRTRRLLAQAVKLQPGNPRWPKDLAEVCRKLGDTAGREAALLQAAADDSDDLASRRVLTALAVGRGDWPAASRWAAAAIEIDTADPALHRALARAEAVQKHDARAIREQETAVILAPDRPELQLELARLYRDANCPQPARRTLEKLLKDFPDQAEARHILATLPPAAK